jgi:adenine-specific DNA-methyltransferase
MWPGKRAAARSAQARASTRLVDVPELSVGSGASDSGGGTGDGAGDSGGAGNNSGTSESNSTGNTIIVGDNLEVLRLLRDTHAGAVKLIYIDPPYNTRSDFVYNDDFSIGVREFRDRHGPHDPRDGPDSGARLHADWLSMMYPRLILAREVLAPDGVGFVSIDGNEVAQLKLMLAEVFGARNVVATIVWVSNLKGRQISIGGPAGTHEYIVCFARDAEAIARFRGSGSEFHERMPAVYRRPGYRVKHDERGPYVTKNELYNTNSRFNERTAPTLVYRIHFNPTTGEVRVSDVDDDTEFPGFVTALPHPNHRDGLRWHAWRWSRAKVLADSDDLEFEVSGESLRIRTKVRDVDGMTLKDVILGPTTAEGQADLDALGMRHLFETPKPVSLLRTLISVASDDDDLVLDFFAGSGSTAQAVLEQNAADGARRRFMLVQLPEPVSPRSDAARAGFETVAALTVERVRRAAERVGRNHPTVDCGFRVQRLATASE